MSSSEKNRREVLGDASRRRQIGRKDVRLSDNHLSDIIIMDSRQEPALNVFVLFSLFCNLEKEALANIFSESRPRQG